MDEEYESIEVLIVEVSSENHVAGSIGDVSNNVSLPRGLSVVAGTTDNILIARTPKIDVRLQSDKTAKPNRAKMQ